MPSEPLPPPGLSALQLDFAAAMRTPLEMTEAPGGYRLHPEQYPDALTARISPDRGQPGAIRLASYNRQYWFRLLSVMQEEYPLLRHLLGISAFNALMVDYLTAHPSTDPRLRHLSDALVGFLEASACEARLVQCARLEHAWINAFDAAHRPLAVLGPDALSAPLQLQPHLTLFLEDWDLVDWRMKVRRDDADEVAVSLTAAPGWWVIWRAAEGVTATRLSAPQHHLLRRIADGEPLAVACAGLATELDPAQTAAVMKGIQGWFARWAAAGWFCESRIEQ